MPQFIEDEYELPDDDYEVPLDLTLARRRRPSLTPWFMVASILLTGIVIALAHNEVTQRQTDDAFCVSCHTNQHKLYSERVVNATAGALAVDLTSYHYQQIRGVGGDIRCIDCHRGDDTTRARIETNWLSLRVAARWLAAGDLPAVQAGAAVITASNGVTTLIGSGALHAPHLSNDGCVACHRDTLLTAGIANHQHNTLPAAYLLWKNGAQLIAPNGPNAADAQIIIARGLVSYNTSLQCGDCHQAHRETSIEGFRDEPTVQARCVQCHTDASVKLPE